MGKRDTGQRLCKLKKSGKGERSHQRLLMEHLDDDDHVWLLPHSYLPQTAGTTGGADGDSERRLPRNVARPQLLCLEIS